jgi:hypothetical protein
MIRQPSARSCRTVIEDGGAFVTLQLTDVQHRWLTHDAIALFGLDLNSSLADAIGFVIDAAIEARP